jgi:hypothetical protein
MHPYLIIALYVYGILTVGYLSVVLIDHINNKYIKKTKPEKMTHDDSLQFCILIWICLPIALPWKIFSIIHR